ncbi:hypothetical protein LTR91_011535 [Friedmanniomyces endolithicus]|uniref:Uncharacterized protein n=1 Tax=Friedmanniomyces endolithicus TaxID=329885 RepID=A0AAN6QRU8_9PEZI|nr:hypothetical protein LTR94_011606 [Friedmanniomyces endolithicus]KAK0791908.1 hypothetical protein LTR38_010033 [Friedmanniomyces endolithicus]KAK0806327.1 hypothetical protein LTR59_003740 [Friedmanniomyces endolithicus]KAK0842095.1 hypothetical protein LTR03_009502 [Friedmanniomyces endolithicus]KAK0865411.1 hypothetical protein LTS02_005392 [Friedmanniomyces endolithicus]
MPTCHAAGVSATLSVANLQASRSNVFDLRMFAEQRLDAERIENVFATGRNLPERPLSTEGDGTGVMQFVGANEDMPLFMVEAGDGLAKARTSETAHQAGDPVGGLMVANTDCPLTSLSGTPDAVDLTFAVKREQSPAPATTLAGRKRAKKAKRAQSVEPDAKPVPTSFSDFERARTFLDTNPNEPQALCLTVQTNHKSFLPKNTDGTKRTGKDLKIEVFLNGELVASSFINTRGSAVELKDDKIRFHGTRVHRQSERLWTYQSAATADAGDEILSALQQWDATSRALEKEARSRGRNKWGDVPPTAELLLALSQHQLPVQLSDQPGLAVFDLLITAGYGKKYGPETAYLLAPTRMDDPEYPLLGEEDGRYAGDPYASDPFAVEDAMLFGMDIDDASPLRGLRSSTLLQRNVPQTSCREPSPFRALSAQQSSPLPQRRSAIAVPQTPTKKARLTDLPELEGIDLNMKLGSFENARGKTARQRTLKQRLSDINQMNPTNRVKSIAALREELDETTLRAISRAAARREVEVRPPPLKKAKVEATRGCEWDAALNMLADAALADDGTIDPQLMNWQSDMEAAPERDRMAYSPDENHPVKAETVPIPERRDSLEFGAGFRRPAELPESEYMSPHSVLDPELVSIDEKAQLTQDRMDRTLESGSNFHTPSISTQHLTPQKKTRASALANSPCAVRVKSPTRQGRTPILTPQRNAANNQNTYYPPLSAPFQNDPLLAVDESPASPSPAKSSGRGANRTRRAWNPTEITLAEALVEAEKKDGLRKGSVVQYAGLQRQRQVGKARSGVFREESVVVGMRFVVI